ncbi:MAG: DUF2164 domain-containing protein [Acidobacteria bacterium]|jgi:uncharacterized protein (DUF2164 family)|nr:DUF2164 domain-containing protein [Acidobacteriota bacterium]
MAITLLPETEKRLYVSIKRFFAEKLDDDIGDLKARLVLDYCLREIGPTIYNQAIADAQAWMQGKVADLDGSRFEPEFNFWKDDR